MLATIITDWLQTCISFGGLLVSAAGLYYVIQTLRAQASVNEAQFQLLAIEGRRAAKEFKPILRLTQGEGKPLPEGATAYPGSANSTITYYLETIGNDAYGICLEYLSVLSPVRYSKNMELGESLGDLFIDSKISLVLLTTWLPVLDKLHMVRIHYKDVNGLPYYKDYKLYPVNESFKEFPPTPYPSMNIISPLNTGDSDITYHEF